MINEIKLYIKDYAVLTIYTASNNIKSKLIDPNGSIKRTIPITNIICNLIDRSCVYYENAIIINNSDNKRLHYDKHFNLAIMEVNENELRFPDLVYVCLSMFSKILADKQKYLLHSSSLIHPSNKGFVLVGDANAGKTSLAYELMDKHGCKLISNDHSIIGMEDGQAKILGGTKEIQMRLGAIELYFPELYKKINITAEDKWNKKVVVNSLINEDLVLDNDEDKALLSNIFSISTTSNGETFMRTKDKVDQFLFLYESMSRIIKGSYNYITGLDYPMPSMENDKNLYELAELCRNILEQAEVSEAKGSVDGLAKTLVSKYER